MVRNRRFEIPTFAFSSDQNSVLEIVDQQIDQINRSRSSIKRVVVQGKAGSGKSTVIKEIIRRITHHLGEQAVAIAAPTGAAAINVEGRTIHSLLRLPLYSSQFKALVGDNAARFQREMSGLRFLIIDEMSMIGARMLFQIEQRCREIFPEIDEPFGGLHVYFFGDFRQLPPVKDSALYSETSGDMAAKGRLVFETFQKFIELKNSHRQATDTTAFPSMLDRLARGSLTTEDYNMICTRREAILANDEKKIFENAVYLFPTNVLANERNEQFLRNTGSPVARLVSLNAPDLSTTATDDSAMGLSSVLKLSVGCRVMLRSNLWVDGGLVNGSLGTITAIIYSQNNGPPLLPDYILVEFDNYGGPYFRNTSFPVIPIQRSWSQQGVTCTRTQFPLALAYAVTIHKSQGLTLSKVVVDVGPREMAPGLTYVALSRVRKLTDLMIIKAHDKGRYDSISNSPGHQAKLEFLRKHHFTP